jgi:hypothetical protein
MVISVMAGGLAIGLLILAIVLKSGERRMRRPGPDGSSVAWMGGGDSACDSGSAGDGGGCDGGGGGGG